MDIVLAVNCLGVIGNNGGLLYNLADDMARFVRLTKGRQVIMGYRTYAEAGRLPNRTNIVIVDKTRPYKEDNKVVYVGSYDEAVHYAQTHAGLEQTVVIGGQRVIQEALQKHDFTIYLTEVEDTTAGDTYFHIPPRYQEVERTSQQDTDRNTGKVYATAYVTYQVKNQKV